MTVRKSVTLSFLMAVGIILQLLESLLPVAAIVPGYKIGFANIASLMALQMYDRKSMWIVGLGRIFLSALLQGTLFSVAFWLSLSGGLAALATMSLAVQTKWFSIFGISVAGAAANSAGQVLAITWIYQQYFMQLYLPVLLALSIVSGLLIALFVQLILRRIHYETRI
ncbi:Gx transporter family protein [Catenisphaera adipataccumulans]|uniref:Heptaprenyl diphosphate synthase n=1 Tax=Catenisphaera adipataccumulans TaxID=700500 RepID=A0A7W8CYR5_9FIRM|nr:Gx transporter family protein [Catenisphaera adipataccumulans]MBB5182868.1 heptaprenyl diphosphate synthase [Catenisphaera adipataccumulans]